MRDETYLVEFLEAISGVPTDDGELSFVPGDQVVLPRWSVQTLRYSWYRILGTPKQKWTNKREVNKVNRTKYG